MYQLDTYTSGSVRAATVRYATYPAMSTAAARITASGHTHSRYSWGPRFTPASRVTTPPTRARFQSQSATLARRGLQSGTTEVRGTTERQRPTITSEARPNSTTFVCAGRARPNERQAYGRNSGQCSLTEATGPAVVPTRSQPVAHAMYSNVTRTVAGSADGAVTRLGSRIRVLIVVATCPGKSKAEAKPQTLRLLPDQAPR